MRAFIAGAVLLMITGCAMFGPAPTNFPDAMGAAALSVKTLAQTVNQECGALTPGGPCRATSLIDQGDVGSMMDDLQRAKDTITQANALYNQGNLADAESSLESAQLILRTLRTALDTRGVQ